MAKGAWLALLVVLAGCANPAPVPDGVPTDDAGRPLPTLQGVVVDEAIRPLANATVRLLGTALEARSDDAGHYELTRPTQQAEAVLVAAFRPGYLARTQQTQLSGYTSTTMNFVLSADAALIPHEEVLQRTDALACQARTVLVPGPKPTACDVEPPSQTGEAPPPANIWVVNPTPGLSGAVFELHWQARTELSRSLHVLLRGPVAGGFSGDTGEVLAEATGTSPLRLEVPEAAARGLPRWTALHLEVGLPDRQGPVPVSWAYDQAYDAYATLFYVDPAPPGYTLA